MQIFLEVSDLTWHTMMADYQNLNDAFDIEFSEKELDSIINTEITVEDIWTLTVEKCKHSLSKHWNYILSQAGIKISETELLEIIKTHTMISTIYTMEELNAEELNFTKLEKTIVEKYINNQAKASQENLVKKFKRNYNRILVESKMNLPNTNLLSNAMQTSTAVKQIESNRNKNPDQCKTLNKYYYKSNNSEVLYALLTAWNFCPYNPKRINNNKYDYMSAFSNFFTKLVKSDNISKGSYSEIPYYLFERLFNMSLRPQ